MALSADDFRSEFRGPQGLRLGLLTHVSGAGDPARILRESIELLIIAEQLGFHSAWVAQHHVRAENGHLPSPFVFLAAAAQRTTRLRLGTGIVMLPLEDPVRVAEDAAVADLLSGGRLELGLGAGTDPLSYAAFGQDFDARSARHTMRRDRLVALLEGEPLVRDIPIHPAAPGLADRIWWATGSETGARQAGAEGRGILLGRSSPQKEERTGIVQRALIDAYRAGFAHRHLSPRIGVTRTIYPAASRAEAVDVLAPGARAWSQKMLGGDIWRTMETDRLFARHNIHCGSPDEIVEKLAADEALADATDLLVQVQPGEPGFARTVRALTTIATDIVPALERSGFRRPDAYGINAASRSGSETIQA